MWRGSAELICYGGFGWKSAERFDRAWLGGLGAARLGVVGISCYGGYGSVRRGKDRRGKDWRLGQGRVRPGMDGYGGYGVEICGEMWRHLAVVVSKDRHGTNGGLLE